ncbi:MAG TPA: glycerol-3-phosphate dehydrogenase/oxidase [Tepidisphaeraceae bacterium]|jgi:glycerol-3-phosphate dehydrogenase|nr:glycerol-3-phosphate dehydrogenase/oxidase [Tepidisphaeraceae bacterium]
MDRSASLRRITSRPGPWDMVVIGGGATGVGIAVDAASRGYSCCLIEQSDFGKGTSSRSTKLVHGGVRYLQQGNVSLVMEALKERGILRQNAPHLVHDLAFVVPNYAWWEAPFYGIGMKVYDMLAFRYGFGRSKLLSKDEVIERIPTLEPDGLRGGVVYYDGQFDDSRLLIDLARTAEAQGAALLNYARVTGMRHDGDGFVDGVTVTDLETGQAHTIGASAVINATGAFSDAVRRIDDPEATSMIAASQGVHLVLDRSFLPGDHAIMVPRTSDGRVMFAIPWHDHALLGTTDTPITEISLEPVAMEHEIQFILETSARYLAKDPTRDDVLSVFTGIRPLVKASDAASTAALSRDHTIHVSKSGLLTIAGGKWTTYRKMAEDCVDHAATLGKLDERDCVTKSLNIHGYHQHAEQFGDLKYHGADAPHIQRLMNERPELADRLHEALPVFGGQVLWAVRHEMARTVDDVLARRTRALLLNAKAAIAMAPRVAQIMAAELGQDAEWQQSQVAEFTQMAQVYLMPAVSGPSPGTPGEAG